ncbi:thiamine phosphate synthase [Sulfobacillus thermosulfidooxidans]|uniref:thiamine phosphate synthase n=1 Tax=Sulfobacillus thermosulfidooxidans TaxID=28034 RepID=UPI0006B6762E|nr:thiamine phosphate synthase [Sulfobacillus thermosulfidooxidans]
MNLQLHVLIDPLQMSLESLPYNIQQMAQGGASVIQLRGKSATTRELLDYGQVVKKLCQQFGLTFIVNDRVDVALALEADGVHVGQDDMPVKIVRKLAPLMHVGLSVSSLEEILGAKNCPPDYFGLGPVFATLSKSDAGKPLGVDQTKQLTQVANEMAPVVAIGGINQNNVDQVWRTGISGVAVISAVIQATDKKQACEQLLAPDKYHNQ